MADEVDEGQMDENQLAHRIVKQATETPSEEEEKQQDSAEDPGEDQPEH